MKISVKNLGVIREADIDLKPFTIFIGPNNAGKTWLAYTIASMLSLETYLEDLNAYVEDPKEEYPQVEETLKNFLETGSATFDLMRFVEENGEKYFNNLARTASSRLQDFMGTDRVDFTNLEAHIHLADQKAELLKQIENARINSSFPSRQQPLIRVQKDAHQATIYFYLPGEDVSNVSVLAPAENNSGNSNTTLSLFPEKVIKEFICRVIFQQIHQALYPNTYIFPTERTVLVTFALGQVLGKELRSRTNELDETEPVQGGKYAGGAISSFFGMMFRLYLRDSSRRDVIRQRNKTYQSLAQLLETEILQGQVNFPLENPPESREVLFSPTTPMGKPVELDLPVVSSMVKELSSLVLYLRHVVQKGDFLVIDEPEMNLHPKAQVQVLEFLAMLVNAGIRVLLTTHSPYFLDHLSNLIKANKSEDKEATSQMFFLQNKNAFLASKDVAVYLVEDGKVENAIDEEGTLEWDTFTNVANKISEIYFSL